MQNDINNILVQISKEFSDIRPLLIKVEGLIKTAIDDNFVQNGRWDGKGTDLFSGGEFRWTPLAPSTKKAYKKKWGAKGLQPTLKRDNGLIQSITVKPSGNSSFVISANKEYAAIHQFGGKINIPPRESSAKWKATKNQNGNYSYQFANKNKTGKSYIERKFQRKAHTITIPPRPYLTLTPKDIDNIVDSITKLIMGV